MPNGEYMFVEGKMQVVAVSEGEYVLGAGEIAVKELVEIGMGGETKRVRIELRQGQKEYLRLDLDINARITSLPSLPKN